MGNDPIQDTLWSIPGDGVLARRGSLVLLISITDQEFTESLLDLLARVGKDGGDGRDLAEAVGAQVERHQSWGGAETGPAVVSFGPAGSGTAFAVSGTASVELSTAHGTERLAVAHPSMVLKSTVGVGVQAIRATLDRDGSSEQTDRFTRLDSGTVRAGGLSYYRAGAAAQAPAAPAGSPVVAASPVPPAAAAPDPGPDPEATAPDRPAFTSGPETGYPDGTDPDGTGPALVLRGPSPSDLPSPSEPEPDYGFSPNTLVGTVIPAVKPAAPGQVPGVLILENGTTLPVDGDYVIGRDPDQDPSVAAGAARPLRIGDAKHTVSRVHARIQLDQGQVLITDLGSANGTHVQVREGEMPLLLEPHVPVPVMPGARIFVGAPCLRYERSVDGNHVGNVL